jgi:GT2 family glycosyltransferase
MAVVISTRNRGANAARAAEAVLRDPGDFELVIVDQNASDETASAVRALEPDPRLRFIRSPLVGISNGRNTGVAATSARIIAFTDDDCRPQVGWASSMIRVFDDPQVALVFGRVHLPQRSTVNCFGASFEPERRVMEGEVPTPESGVGIGANCAIRREVFEALGGFDPLLGVGAPFFRAGEDVDLLIRTLHAGYRVVNATECDVLHLGVRTGGDIRPLAVHYQLATGAALGKHARMAGLSGIRNLWRWTKYYTGEAITNTIRFRESRLGAPLYFVVGAFLTFRYRIDHVKAVFKTRRST